MANVTTHSAATRDWMRVLAKYRGPNPLRSVLELMITALPLAILWIAMCTLYGEGYWLSLLLIIPAAGFLVRLFMIQHDCGHGAFFRHRLTNDWTGRVIGVLTLTPYDLWRRSHATHHATSGNLDRRGVGDIHTLTLQEYQARSFFSRLKYRLYRHPVIMFAFGPAFLFLLWNRLPIGYMRDGWQPWFSTMATNAATLTAMLILIWLIGLETFLLLYLPMTLLAASIGVWLFFVQHQFKETSWDRDQHWRFQEAALQGSSHYDLPAILRWFTGNIGVHHVHHLCSRIPYYRLPRALHDHPELKNISRLTLIESFRCVRLTLWDEARRALISFREAKCFV